MEHLFLPSFKTSSYMILWRSFSFALILESLLTPFDSPRSQERSGLQAVKAKTLGSWWSIATIQFSLHFHKKYIGMIQYMNIIQNFVLLQLAVELSVVCVPQLGSYSFQLQFLQKTSDQSQDSDVSTKSPLLTWESQPYLVWRFTR